MSLDRTDRYISEIQAIRNYKILQLRIKQLEKENSKLENENAKMKEFIKNMPEKHGQEYLEDLEAILSEMREQKPNYPQWVLETHLPDRIKELISDWFRGLPLLEKYSISGLYEMEINEIRDQIDKTKKEEEKDSTTTPSKATNNSSSNDNV